MSYTFSGQAVTDDAGTVFAVQAAAYAAGKLVGKLIQVNEAGRQASGGRGGFLTRFALYNKLSGGVTQSMIFHFLVGAAPSLSTLTDNTTIVFNALDYTKITKSVTVLSTDWVAKVGQSPWATFELIDPSNGRPFIPFDLGATSKLYVAIEAGGTITWAAVDDLRIRMAGEHD